ncbi:MAG: 50S ribosomal protein L37ae [Candidatus Pacearchaeota archaeon]
MVKRTKKVKSTGRFGSRYGLKVRKKVMEIEVLQRKKQPCIYCGKNSAKRIAYGIYKCKSCGKKFTGKAYFVK